MGLVGKLLRALEHDQIVQSPVKMVDEDWQNFEFLIDRDTYALSMHLSILLPKGENCIDGTWKSGICCPN